jgi:hypothetical protein
MEFRIEFSGDYCLATTTGDANAEGFSELLNSVFTHGSWRPGKSLVVDHSALIADALTSDDIKRMADRSVRNHSMSEIAMHAIIAPRDLQFGLGRMWMSYVEYESKAAINVFRTRKEAINWVSA